MIDFADLRVKNIYALLSIIQQSTLRKRDNVLSLYSQSCENFDSTLTFLLDIGALVFKQDSLALSTKSISVVRAFSRSDSPHDVVRSFIQQQLLSRRCPYSLAVQGFLSRFKPQEGKLIYEPAYTENLKFSGLRNFLIDLELVDYDPTYPKYYLRNEHLPPALHHTQISPSALRLYNLKCEDFGHKAELAVMALEEERLASLPQLASMLDHVAIRDVHAGYDIISYETELESGRPVPRYIEVKAVSQWDFAFHWTANEMRKASHHGKLYWLYLLPVLSGSRFDLDNMLRISDPYKTIVKNKDKWGRKCEVHKFWITDPRQNPLLQIEGT